MELSGGSAAELLTLLAEAVAEADRTVRKAATDDQQPVSTLTALLRRGSQLALVHIGDTRAYLLRYHAALHTALGAAAEPDQVVQQLIALAYAQGAPDNIACDVVAE